MKTLWCFTMWFVAFVGLNNNTIVYAQYRIWIGLFWPIPPIRQKMSISERCRYWISDRRTLPVTAILMSLCGIFILKNLMKQEVVAYSLRVSDQYGVHQSCSNESCRTKMAWQIVVASANKPAHPLQNNVGLLSFWSPVVEWTKNPTTEWMNTNVS